MVRNWTKNFGNRVKEVKDEAKEVVHFANFTKKLVSQLITSPNKATC